MAVLEECKLITCGQDRTMIFYNIEAVEMAVKKHRASSQDQNQRPGVRNRLLSCFVKPKMKTELFIEYHH